MSQQLRHLCLKKCSSFNLKPMKKYIARNIFMMCTATALLFESACSSNRSDGSSALSSTVAEAVTSTLIAVPSETTASFGEPVSVIVPFTAGNASGTVAVSGYSLPVAAWFGSLSSEVLLDLLDADVSDSVSVLEELVSFWFFQDDDSGDVQPSILEPAIGNITDSAGISYAVEAQLLQTAPVAKTTITRNDSSTVLTTISPAPETSETPSVTTSSTTTVTTSTVADFPVILQIQELKESCGAGTAGRMTDKLSQAETSKRYISLAVYLTEGWQTKAKETLQAAEMGEINQPISMPRSSLEKIKSNLFIVFDVRGFLSITTFIVSRQ